MPRPEKGPGQPALVLNHSGEQKTFFLNKNAITVGRARGCDVSLDSDDVSAIHCVICRSTGFYEVRDCNSRTGIRVNGDEVTEGVLHDGDILLIGMFSFQVALPDKKSAGGGVDRKLKHLDRSRRNYARLALELRKKLQTRGPAKSKDAGQKTSGLRLKVRDFEQRQTQLELAERELARGRDLLEKERKEFKASVAEVEKELASWEEHLAKKKAELDQQSSKDSAKERAASEAWLKEQTESLRSQQESLQLAEESLRQQRGELTRMIAELREIQDALRIQQKPDSSALQEENDLLRRQIEELQSAPPVNTGPSEELLLEFEQLRNENQSLKQLVEQRDAALGELQKAKPREEDTDDDKDLESYEAELNRFRQQLEADRKKLAAELEQVRLRNQELDDAMREMEMEQSRERAELARERTRLDRMREEIRAENERIQRDGAVLQNLAPVQKLRQDLSGKKPVSAAANDKGLDERLRSFNNRLRGNS